MIEFAAIAADIYMYKFKNTFDSMCVRYKKKEVFLSTNKFIFNLNFSSLNNTSSNLGSYLAG